MGGIFGGGGGGGHGGCNHHAQIPQLTQQNNILAQNYQTLQQQLTNAQREALEVRAKY